MLILRSSAGRFLDHQRRFTHGLWPWYAQWVDIKPLLAMNFRVGYEICLDRINGAPYNKRQQTSLFSSKVKFGNVEQYASIRGLE